MVGMWDLLQHQRGVWTWHRHGQKGLDHRQ